MAIAPSLSFADQPTDAVGAVTQPPEPPPEQTPPPADTGLNLGHFQVTEILGRGGCGLVLKAFDRKLHRTVAVKVLSGEAAANPTARKRFLREARAAAAVRNEHVVPIHAVEDGPNPYLVLEYLPGGSLQQRFERTGRFTPADVIRVGAQVARGLAAAHDRGIVHRDVKPANVFLDAGPELAVKIGDFGLVWVADDAGVSRDGAVVGTPYYMSPEQARGEPVDHRSDLFALGSVMYLLAAGRLPFAGASSAGVIHRVAYEPPTPAHVVAPDVPRWLGAIIARLHASDPDDRYRSATELADVLDACGRELTR
ncbi:MAG TPA: serine/threonine-protein kinase, partial [Urbifossiella sp.]|nr:serine/threonine-protein kinase [Urbifossiella sp.]